MAWDYCIYGQTKRLTNNSSFLTWYKKHTAATTWYNKPAFLYNKQTGGTSIITLQKIYRNCSYTFEITSPDPFGGDV